VILWNHGVILWNRDVIPWNRDVILVFAARFFGFFALLVMVFRLARYLYGGNSLKSSSLKSSGTPKPHSRSAARRGLQPRGQAAGGKKAAEDRKF
jgi:hypothetical protein